MDQRPIGFFDSGIGGLTALKVAKKLLPHEDTIYVADEANLPYGTKSPAAVTDFSRKIINFLIDQNVKAIVCACNTSSALALPKLSSEFDLPILGVIEAGSQKANQTTKNRHIAVLATQATVASKKYDEELKTFNSDLVVQDFAAQELVAIVENGDYSSNLVLHQINEVLAPLAQSSADTLILGCTHFPILAPQITQVTKQRFQIVDPGKEVVIKLRNCLTQWQILQDENQHLGKHLFYTTGSCEHLFKLGSNFLGDREIKVRHLDLK